MSVWRKISRWIGFSSKRNRPEILSESKAVSVETPTSDRLQQFQDAVKVTEKALGISFLDQKTPLAKHCLGHPPTCIEAWRATPIVRPGEMDIEASFRLSCKVCQSEDLQIFCTPESISDDGVDEVLEGSPHDVQCVKCGFRHLVFDYSIHGYDGALGHNNVVDSKPAIQRPVSAKKTGYVVEVVFLFNSELEELTDISSETGVPLQDLFDAFGIIAEDKNGNVLWDMDYECA